MHDNLNPKSALGRIKGVTVNNRTGTTKLNPFEQIPANAVFVFICAALIWSFAAVPLFAKKKPAPEIEHESSGTPNTLAAATDYDQSRVGPQENNRIIVPTNQVLTPAGRQVIVGGRPTDVA